MSPAQTAHVLCAGHPQPLLIRDGDRAGRRALRPDARRVARQPLARRTASSSSPGDVLVLYTDGVTDARGDDERFGDERLLAALRGATDAAGAVAAIDRALNAFQRGAQADDTAILALDLPPS